MSTSTGWVVSLIILVVLGGGAYWAYRSYQASDTDAMMHEDTMATTSDNMMRDDKMASSTDSMMKDDKMSSSSDAMMKTH